MDESNDQALCLDNIKKHLQTLEKRLTVNQRARLEYPDDPTKWIKSEVDLDEQIQVFRDLPALPELYDDFEKLKGLDLFAQLLLHANTDICIATLNVLAELLDPEIILNLENAESFVDKIENLNLLKLVIENILKIDEENGEIDYDGVKSCLELSENLIELLPDSSEFLANNEDFLKFLLNRLKSSKTIEYDSNRIHACELLAILLQESNECRRALAKEDGLNGIDSLLRTIAKFRKQEPKGVEEEELIENVVQCLCYLMFIPENQRIFGKLQGIKFALRLLKERTSTYGLAVKLLDYALMDSPSNCALFVDALGLKSIFAIFMRKKVSTKVGSEAEKTEDEHVTSIIHSLAAQCVGNHAARLLNKFVEHKYEKLERLLELHLKYTKMVNNASTSSAGKNATSAMLNALNVDKENQEYLQLYEAGLSVCQMVGLILVRLYNMGNTNLGTCMLVLAHNKGVDIQDVYDHVTSYIEHLAEDAAATKNSVQSYLVNFLKAAYDSQLFK